MIKVIHYNVLEVESTDLGVGTNSFIEVKNKSINLKTKIEKDIL